MLHFDKYYKILVEIISLIIFLLHRLRFSNTRISIIHSNITFSFFIDFRFIVTLKFFYLDEMDMIVAQNETSVIEKLWDLINKHADEAIAKNSIFRVGLSGGSLINFLSKGAEKCTTDWSKWELYFCDERFVDETNEHSTFGEYKKNLIPNTKLTEAQFVVINRKLSLTECAIDYENQIYEKFAIEKVCLRLLEKN